MNTKTCPKCKIEKPFGDYYKNKAKKFGIRAYCKDCTKIISAEKYQRKKVQYNGRQRQWQLNNPEKVKKIRRKCRAKSYGLTLEEHQELIDASNNKCYICGQDNNNTALCIDHDHSTGLVRGLLCTSCNIGLGKFSDNPEILIKAVEYLRTNMPQLHNQLTNINRQRY